MTDWVKNISLHSIWNFCVTFLGWIALAIILLVSILWVPVRLWFRPRKLAKFLVREEPSEDCKKAKQVLYEVVNYHFKFWRRIIGLCSMHRRRFFLDRMRECKGFDLKSMPIDDQIAYFDASPKGNRVAVAGGIADAAIVSIWERDDIEGQIAIATAFKNQGRKLMSGLVYRLFQDDQEKQGFLQELAKNDVIDEDTVEAIVKFFVRSYSYGQKFTDETNVPPLNEECLPKVKEVLLFLRLTTNAMKDLMLVIGEEDAIAYKVLTAWQKKNTLPSVIVDKLIDFSTSNILDDRQSRAWSLLQQHLSQNWATEEQIQRLSQKADGSQASMLNQILLVRRGLAAVKNGAGAWENYLRELRTLELTAAPLEVQKKMNFEQYKAYHKVKGLVLLPEAFDFLLLSLKESDKDFFETLVKEQNEAMGDASEVLPTVMLVPWKRDSLLKLKEDNDGGLPL